MLQNHLLVIQVCTEAPPLQFSVDCWWYFIGIFLVVKPIRLICRTGQPCTQSHLEIAKCPTLRTRAFLAILEPLATLIMPSFMRGLGFQKSCIKMEIRGVRRVSGKKLEYRNRKNGCWNFFCSANSSKVWPLKSKCWKESIFVKKGLLQHISSWLNLDLLFRPWEFQTRWCPSFSIFHRTWM